MSKVYIRRNPDGSIDCMARLKGNDDGPPEGYAEGEIEWPPELLNALARHIVEVAVERLTDEEQDWP